jgi:hypothetical protein
MQMDDEEKNSDQTGPSVVKRELNIDPAFNAPMKPIADFVTRPDYPECLVGEHVDIGGYTGVVVGIVKQSIRVKSPEGATRGFNSHGLKRIYGPSPESEPMKPSSPPLPPSSPESSSIFGTHIEPPRPTPKREVIEEPDFNKPIVKIADLVTRRDFPKCAFGMHVDIGGYTGVVVELIKDSLKVRSPQGLSRTYNAVGLRKIYGLQ